ncbi:uncharacterized protein LOC144152883 [Haemaphysalis longicornis]
MAKVAYVALCAHFLFTMAMAELGHPPGPQKLHYDEADSFTIWETFESVMAISDADNDTVFECVSAWRTAIDPIARAAIFNVDFGDNGVLPFNVKQAETPSAFLITVGEDPTLYEGQYYFTDYEYCYITYLNLNGNQCILWTIREVKDNVPQHCIDQFVDTCGVIVPKYSRDLCFDGEGDYK